MANPYTQVSITGYNSNPPDDDGSETEANRVKWATIKTKITDPVKTRTDGIDTNVAAAIAKMPGGAGVVSYSTDTTVAESDQGKLVHATTAGITITTPDATSVGAPFQFDFKNGSDGDVAFAGNDTQTVDDLSSVTVPSGAGFTVRTDGSNWFTTGQNFQRTQVQPQGYLTLLSVASSPLSPMPSSDQTAKSTVYYRPDKGNLVPVSDGTSIRVRAFSELSLTLNSNHVANGIYDVFLFDDSGTLTLGTGPVWNTVTAGSGARGTGSGTTELDVLNGLPVNKVAMTARNGSTTYSVAAKAGMFLGSILIDGTAGQVTCHVSYGQARKWGVSNAYNQRPVILRGGDSTASWTYMTTTNRQSHGDADNKVTVLNCLPGGFSSIAFKQKVEANGTLASNSENTMAISIGQNAVSVAGLAGYWHNGPDAASGISNYTGGGGILVAEYKAPPFIGINDYLACERPIAIAGTITWYGTEANMLLSAEWMG